MSSTAAGKILYEGRGEVDFIPALVGLVLELTASPTPGFLHNLPYDPAWAPALKKLRVKALGLEKIWLAVANLKDRGPEELACARAFPSDFPPLWARVVDVFNAFFDLFHQIEPGVIEEARLLDAAFARVLAGTAEFVHIRDEGKIVIRELPTESEPGERS